MMLGPPRHPRELERPHTPPPLRLLLVWDNPAGHLSWSIVPWLFAQGAMPRYTPLSGSWPNMAESLQRIVAGRALAGEHPRTPQDIIGWLEQTVAGRNAAPTPDGSVAPAPCWPTPG